MMIATRRQSLQLTKRYISNHATKNKRFIQTIPISTNTGSNSFLSKLHQSEDNDVPTSKWARHTLSFPKTETSNTTPQPPVRKSRTSRFANKSTSTNDIKQFNSTTPTSQSNIIEITSDPEIQKASNKITSTSASVPTEIKSAATPSVTPKKKRVLRPRKALITLTSSAVQHLQGLLDQPDPKLIRIGVRNRGCSGLTYNLEYVDKPGKFDELVEQDGVKVLIDSKALFSIVGSEMDWLDDKLSSRFIFKNPNSKGTCGCGESFMV
ncbi:iron sulfur assembly protein, putative [Candida dubliniensis CD36]|uniref:Iron-sulfur assembly protein 1 n=1 Tax=Candida dubliniensis (strain CD36 / ATCC MYA-646 / CBS 7987 / NCPF 3949 / NRRL Y-17841) TaxID=573826 RepID=B9WIW2_CANDC|nr:iron sulfur assembly protein, putative [Candida dubliniensis CD36]CAX41180.1 iron sulfur assembly protein, putative [Candida dubliniensis CD36]